MSDKSQSGDKKLKFYDQGLSRDLEIDRIVYVPGMLPTSSNHQSNNTDIETYLLHPENTFKKKSSVTLNIDDDNKGKDYRNFTLEGKEMRKNLYVGNYMNNGYKGQGRGTGDYEISSKLRYGYNSRLESNETRQADISEIKLNSANLGLNDPNTNVLPFPRGGIDTRNLEKFRKEN